jgi:hypothetical protein
MKCGENCRANNNVKQRILCILENETKRKRKMILEKKASLGGKKKKLVCPITACTIVAFL